MTTNAEQRLAASKCEGCGRVPAHKGINLVNGHLYLCKMCLAELNGKNPELLTIRSKLAPLLAGETVECPDCDGEVFTPHRCKRCAGTPGRIPLDPATLSTGEMVDLLVEWIPRLHRERTALLDMANAAESRAEKIEAWNNLVMKEATEVIRRAGGIGEGGHTVDRLVFLDAHNRKLTQLIEQLEAELNQAKDDLAGYRKTVAELN